MADDGYRGLQIPSARPGRCSNEQLAPKARIVTDLRCQTSLGGYQSQDITLSRLFRDKSFAIGKIYSHEHVKCFGLEKRFLVTFRDGPMILRHTEPQSE